MADTRSSSVLGKARPNDERCCRVPPVSVKKVVPKVVRNDEQDAGIGLGARPDANGQCAKVFDGQGALSDDDLGKAARSSRGLSFVPEGRSLTSTARELGLSAELRTSLGTKAYSILWV
ncbi:hypothetical protein JDV02_010857 [Purpureocillium takamizusanense]|uniref:Uncharacterized protein n=1 Tax=Purpureocillium takamizusanense TaxID=2060973 RepID=A0A9Q8QHK9_9HYPO|nr:uncharacterized protein JDV02_010857 [Purpureocillium takamizusanense]UNI19795.1 hypothetical protein JDV02_010857 [Purpureocillium takamizusanense]